MFTGFDITGTVSKYSVLPLERVRIVRNFEDLPLPQIRRGVIYLLAAWSGPSIMFLRHVTKALARLDLSTVEFFVADIDCIPEEFLARIFDRRTPAGAGETLWVRDGVVVASIFTYSRTESESEVMKRTRELFKEDRV